MPGLDAPEASRLGPVPDRRAQGLAIELASECYDEGWSEEKRQTQNGLSECKEFSRLDAPRASGQLKCGAKMFYYVRLP